MTLIDQARPKPGLVGVVVRPDAEDLVYAHEVYTAHGVGPEFGQVLVCWRPNEPRRGTWHWPDDLRVLCTSADHRARVEAGGLQASRRPHACHIDDQVR